MEFTRRDMGWVEVICGPMFSGKTEELIRRLRRAVIARQRVQVFKPTLDVRYHETRITSHSAAWLEAEVVPDIAAIEARLREDSEVVGIDEAQFFGPPLVPLVQRVADQGRRVIVAGLDQDYRAEPFEPMPQLLAVAEQITKCLAICARCGGPAGRSQRLDPQGERIQVGAADLYEARCRRCHEREAAAPCAARS